MFFPEVTEITVHISKVYNTSLSKNYVAHSITVMCDRLNLRKKQVYLRSLALCTYEISRRTSIFSTNSNSTTKRLKHSLNFESVENVRSSNIFEFELCHISTYSNYWPPAGLT